MAIHLYNVVIIAFFGFLKITDLAVAGPEELLIDGRAVVSTENSIALIRGRHPRLDGLWHQYERLGTRLRANVIISDVINEESNWEFYDGTKTNPVDLSQQTPENYHSTHNHYQNLLSEVSNYFPGTNAVAIWGDSAALVDGASAWGGFFSARSSCSKENLHEKYKPQGTERNCGPNFDAQLTGLEVDVLNGGKPSLEGNLAKHGVQVVGFGNPNGQAYSVIVKNFDREPEFQEGHFESILYAQNSISPEYGRMIVADFARASIGLDFRRPIFRNGAISLRSNGLGTGIEINNGVGGGLHAGERWAGSPEEGNDWLTLRAGATGIRIVSNDATTEFLAIDKHGGIYLNGDLFLNGAQFGLGARKGERALAILPLINLGLLLVLGLSVLLRKGLTNKFWAWAGSQ